MATRSVLVVSPNLTALQKGKIYTQKEIGLDDDELDAFIAKGYGIEHEVKRKRSAPKPAPKPEIEVEVDDGPGDDEPSSPGGVQQEDG